MAWSDYLSWDFMNASPGNGASTPGSGTNDLTTAQKVGRGGQIANTLLRDIFSEQDARMQRKRDLEQENARLYDSYQSRLPSLIKARQEMADRVSGLSSLSRMF